MGSLDGLIKRCVLTEDEYREFAEELPREILITATLQNSNMGDALEEKVYGGYREQNKLVLDIPVSGNDILFLDPEVVLRRFKL